MVKALFDTNILVDYLKAVSQPTILASACPTIVSPSQVMNAGQKRASISTTLVFANLRQVTNELVEAHPYSILADDIQQDRSVLLPSYESTSLAHPMEHSMLRKLTWKSTGRQPRTRVAGARWLLASRRCSFRRSPIFPSSTLATHSAVRMKTRQIKELPDFIG
jgi:hypothetical protein